MLRVETEGYAVFLFPGFAQRRPSARMFESVAWIRLFVLDHRDESCKGEFWLTKHKLALLHFHTPLAFGRNMLSGLFSPANTRSNPYAPDKDATG